MFATRRILTVLALSIPVLGMAAPAAAQSCDAVDRVVGCPPPEPQPAPQPEPQPSQPQPSQPQAAPVRMDPAKAAQRLLELANNDRARAGAPALAMRDDVVRVAVGHSNAMRDRGDIWHNDAYFTADMRQRLGAKALAENVAMNASIDDAHRRLMASPGHRANLLDRRFTVVGMGVALGSDGRYYVTQNFVQPVAAAPAGAGAGATRPVAAPRANRSGIAPRTPATAPAAPATAAAPRPVTAETEPVAVPAVLPVEDSVPEIRLVTAPKLRGVETVSAAPAPAEPAGVSGPLAVSAAALLLLAATGFARLALPALRKRAGATQPALSLGRVRLA